MSSFQTCGCGLFRMNRKRRVRHTKMPCYRAKPSVLWWRRVQHSSKACRCVQHLHQLRCPCISMNNDDGICKHSFSCAHPQAIPDWTICADESTLTRAVAALGVIDPLVLTASVHCSLHAVMHSFNMIFRQTYVDASVEGDGALWRPALLQFRSRMLL